MPLPIAKGDSDDKGFSGSVAEITRNRGQFSVGVVMRGIMFSFSFSSSVLARFVPEVFGVLF